MIRRDVSTSPHADWLPPEAPLAARGVPASLRDRVLASAADTPSRTRAQGRTRAVVAYGLAALAGVLFFEAWGGLSHSDGRPRSLTFGLAGGATLLALAASSVGWWRGRTMLGRPWQLLAAAPLLVPGLTLGWLLAFHDRYVEPFARFGWRCLFLSLGSGAALLGAALFLRRRSVVRAPGLSGAALGATAGSWSAILVDLWCPLTNVPHALVGHVVPLVLLSVVGGIAGYVVLPWRAAPR
jgi:hypothetical protein